MPVTLGLGIRKNLPGSDRKISDFNHHVHHVYNQTNLTRFLFIKSLFQGVCKKFFKYMTLVYSFKGTSTPPPLPKFLNKEFIT